MKHQLLKLVMEAQTIPTRGDRHLAALGLVRITLQYLCIGLAEWLVMHGSLSNQPQVRATFIQLRAPTDGTLVDGLVELLIGAENSGWIGVSAPMWRFVDNKRPSAAIGGATLHELLGKAVWSRNDGAEGHGIAGDEDPDALLDVVILVTERLGECFPTNITGSSQLCLQAPDGRSAAIELLRMFDDDLVCYRRIKQLRAGRCRVEAQRQTSLSSKTDVAWEARDILRNGELSGKVAYDFWVTAEPSWQPLVLLPDRLTDTFLGREQHLTGLLNWMNDGDSLACMVYGDGGIGKTALILEFLHRLMEGSLVSQWKPQVISYFTAKRTQWGIHGLEALKLGARSVVDVCRYIVGAWDGGPVGKDWLTDNSAQIIDRLGGYLKDKMDVERKHHLLVLDNTETLASSPEEVRALAQNIHRLTRRVGRVLLTSRRLEPIEAHSLELLPLNEDESVALLRARGVSSKLQSVVTASERTLRKYANDLGRRPLVLEVFLQVLGEPGLGLQQAFDRVQRMQRQDLGEFLYSDAWARFSQQIKHVILLMTRVADVLDEPLVKLCCLEVNASVMAVYEALRESRGIATLPTIAGQTQVVFNADFLRFCVERTVVIQGAVMPAEFSVSRVRRRYDEFIQARSKQIQDRLSSAFRKPFARLAFAACQEGNLEECETYYELAIVEDPTNALLFDRYAMFLFQWRRRLDDALSKAIRATELDANDAETWFTRGMIEGRLKRSTSAISSLNKSMDLGKEKHLVWVQIAYAHIFVKDYPNAMKATQIAGEATPKDGGFRLEKHRQELLRLRVMTPRE